VHHHIFKQINQPDAGPTTTNNTATTTFQR